MRVTLPFKDQTSANAVKRQRRDLSHKIGNTLQPIFISRKLEEQDLKSREIKGSIVNQQYNGYSFTCDLCDYAISEFTSASILSARSLLWKPVFIHIEIGTNYHSKSFALRLTMKERLRGTRKWPFRLCRLYSSPPSSTYCWT